MIDDGTPGAMDWHLKGYGRKDSAARRFRLHIYPRELVI